MKLVFHKINIGIAVANKVHKQLLYSLGVLKYNSGYELINDMYLTTGFLWNPHNKGVVLISVGLAQAHPYNYYRSAL